MSVFSVVFLRGGVWSSNSKERCDALVTLGLLLGLFSLGRCISWLADGSAQLRWSMVVWIAEVFGACFAAVLWMYEKAPRDHQHTS